MDDVSNPLVESALLLNSLLNFLVHLLACFLFELLELNPLSFSTDPGLQHHDPLRNRDALAQRGNGRGLAKLCGQCDWGHFLPAHHGSLLHVRTKRVQGDERFGLPGQCCEVRRSRAIVHRRIEVRACPGQHGQGFAVAVFRSDAGGRRAPGVRPVQLCPSRDQRPDCLRVPDIRSHIKWCATVLRQWGLNVAAGLDQQPDDAGLAAIGSQVHGRRAVHFARGLHCVVRTRPFLAQQRHGLDVPPNCCNAKSWEAIARCPRVRTGPKHLPHHGHVAHSSR